MKLRKTQAKIKTFFRIEYFPLTDFIKQNLIKVLSRIHIKIMPNHIGIFSISPFENMFIYNYL